jgi:hypothetical protein
VGAGVNHPDCNRELVGSVPERVVLKANMSVPTHLQEVRGAAELDNWFGYWPSFHDAEVLSLHLNRAGASFLTIHAWEMTKDVDESGFYVLDKHCVVELEFDGIRNLIFDGFNEQNVLLDLNIEKIESSFRVSLNPSYGVQGSFETDKLSFRIIPGKPSSFD